MAERLTYSLAHGMCCYCHNYTVQQNEFGVCAKCFVEMPEHKQAALLEGVRIVERTVYVPTPKMRWAVVLAGVVAAVVSFGVAAACWRFGMTQ